MANQCTTQPPSPPVVCNQNSNKCMASTTSRMLYYTLVKKLDERDSKKPIATTPPLAHSPDPPSTIGNEHDFKRPRLNPIPNPKRRKPPILEPITPPTISSSTTTSSADCERKYYCYSKMRLNDKKCCSECRLVIRENIDGSWSLL